MSKYDLTEEEDLRLHLSIMLPNKRPLYEYFLELPLEDLQAYPEKGYRRWMGRSARTSQALALRDYILHCRFAALTFRQTYPRDYLETLTHDDMQSFLCAHIQKAPVWVYEGPVKDVLQLLLYSSEPQETKNALSQNNGL